jgi:hypothetical protein
VQRILGEPVLVPQRSEGTDTIQLLGAWNGTGGLPGGIGPHVSKAPLAF